MVGLIYIIVFVSNLKILEASSIKQLPSSFRFEGSLDMSTALSHDKTVVCILDSWSHWRPGEGEFDLTFVDPTLCTQIVYRNAGLDNNTFRVRITDSYLNQDLQWYKKIVALGRAFPHVKVLLSVGGWSEGSWRFSQIAEDYKKREVFLESVVRILKEYGFNGIDIAWEYPTWTNRGGTPRDKDNLSILLRELRAALGGKYLLSLTVTGGTPLARQAYNIRAISASVDQINIRTFDFAGGWSNRAYHHSALKDSEIFESVEKSVNFYLSNGAPPEKLIVGIPLYGRTFLLQEQHLSSADLNKVDTITKVSGFGEPSKGSFGGRWDPDDNMAVGFHEICHNITQSDNGWKTYKDDFRLVPFARHEQHWISYDDLESVEFKVEFMLDKQLKGVMAWSIDTDDFRGKACRRSDEDVTITYPVLRTINYAIYSHRREKSEIESIGETDAETKASESEDTIEGEQEGQILLPKGPKGKEVDYEHKRDAKALLIVVTSTAVVLMVLQTIFTAVIKRFYKHH